jgi:hypothetical protein
MFWATVAATIFAAIAAGGAWYYAHIANGQLDQLKVTNTLTSEAQAGSDRALSETLVEMEGQIEQMSRLADGMASAPQNPR